MVVVQRRQLFCALTNRYMNRNPAEVELHLKGKRYRRALDNCKSLSVTGLMNAQVLSCVCVCVCVTGV